MSHSNDLQIRYCQANLSTPAILPFDSIVEVVRFFGHDEISKFGHETRKFALALPYNQIFGGRRFVREMNIEWTSLIRQRTLKWEKIGEKWVVNGKHELPQTEPPAQILGIGNLHIKICKEIRALEVIIFTFNIFCRCFICIICTIKYF